MHRNDKISAADVVAAAPEAIVLSPGPCTPNEAGICLDLIAKASPTIPILGVCLGHQAIGQCFGGKVVRAPVPVHGKLSAIKHEGQGVFRGINGPFQATRYHSLVVDRATHARHAFSRGRDRRPAGDGARARKPSGARRAIPSRKHRVRARPSDPEELSRDCGRLERRGGPDRAQAAGAARGALRAREKGARERDRRFQGADRQGRIRRVADARGGRARLRPHDVGRGHAIADGRPADGAARARRDRRRDHRRRVRHAREDAARHRAARRHRRGRHRRRCLGLLQHLDLRGLHRGGRGRSGRQARQPRALLALRRRRRAGRARRQDRARRRSRSGAASTRPASASCSRPRIIRR